MEAPNKTRGPVKGKWTLLAAVIVAGLVGAVITSRQYSFVEDQEEEARENLELGDDVDGAVRRVVMDEGRESRWEAIEDLGSPLSESEEEVLFEFLAGERPNDLSANLWHAYFNDVVEHLMREDLCLDELGVFLIETALDENQDPVIRDYAVQFIPQWLTNSGPNESGVEGDVETREALLGVLEETLTLRHESIAGTALLGLNELASQEVLSLEDYREDAVAAAIGRDVHPLTRITALQVAAEHGWAEALPVVRQLIDDPETSGSLRLSAIAALGALGTESDRHWFVAARNNHPEERFGGALVAAQQRLQARLND